MLSKIKNNQIKKKEEVKKTKVRQFGDYRFDYIGIRYHIISISVSISIIIIVIIIIIITIL